MEVKPEYITIALCTCNRQTMLRGALESLVSLNTTPEFKYEIVIVDDASTDGTPSVAKSIRDKSPIQIQYFRHDINKGVAAARNQCVRMARGTWIAFFDDDEIADPDWLTNLIATARATGADCVGGPYLVRLPGRTLPASLRRMLGENPIMRKRLPRRLVLDPRRRQNAMAAAMGTGNVLISRQLFEQIGMFCETLRRGEDIQFFLRAHRQGAKFAIAPDAIIHHVIPAERLKPEHLLSAADRGGKVNCQMDVEVAGIALTLWTATMRCAHLVLWTLPGLLAFSLLRDRDRALGKQCSARFAAGYLATMVNFAFRHVVAGRAS